MALSDDLRKRAVVSSGLSIAEAQALMERLA
jgi:hypothetical protein